MKNKWVLILTILGGLTVALGLYKSTTSAEVTEETTETYWED